jgi:3-isopropylmalate/(R)-2-methylmalate dehydratase small subunit
MAKTITSKVFVVRDNIDTDQIIPAQYLALVPTIAEEYEKLGSYALVGLPDDQYPEKFVPEGTTKTPYAIIIAGRNFGCGSSREHAPIALGAAGVEAVVAESFARIFFRNSVATGELYPFDSPQRLCDIVKTGDEATLDLDSDLLTVNGVSYQLKPLGDVRPVIDAGGLFNYARKSGMIASAE